MEKAAPYLKIVYAWNIYQLQTQLSSLWKFLRIQVENISPMTVVVQGPRRPRNERAARVHKFDSDQEELSGGNDIMRGRNWVGYTFCRKERLTPTQNKCPVFVCFLPFSDTLECPWLHTHKCSSWCSTFLYSASQWSSHVVRKYPKSHSVLFACLFPFLLYPLGWRTIYFGNDWVQLSLHLKRCMFLHCEEERRRRERVREDHNRLSRLSVPVLTWADLPLILDC